MQPANLLSVPTLVQAPFIIAEIGGVTFGTYTKARKTRATYPNYMESITIQKVNGTVNTYTLNFNYQVAPGQDPNLLDKIFSRATKDRRVVLQYGDWMAPNYIYKEEQCIITNVTSRLNMSGSSISYSIQCTSDAIGLNATKFNFPAREAKGSDVLLGLFNNAKYGLKKVFTGMRSTASILSNNLIANNDKKIHLLPQNKVSVFDYINYVVGCMTSVNTLAGTALSASRYFLSVYDDFTNALGGTYFKVSEVKANGDASSYNALNTYEIDINYPGDNFVTEFSLTNDQSWAILYEYAGNIKQEEYSYIINDDGVVETVQAPSMMISNKLNDTSAYKSQWWTMMTKFPIQATLTIKGLTRPAILMTYVKLNVLFAGGQKHISSGMYIVTRQTDVINSSGYSTTLTLLRVGGDE